MLINSDPFYLMTIIPLFMISIGMHEAAHAYAVNAFGDDTPASQGRLTINPLAHLDLFGSLMLLFVGFGWGKSVPYNPNQLKSKRWSRPAMEQMIAAAGPGANFLLALISMVGLALVYQSSLSFLSQAFLISAILNTMLMFLNLVPIPPLDGSKVLRPWLPYPLMQQYDKLEPYGSILLIALFFLPGLRELFMGGLHFLTFESLGQLGKVLGLAAVLGT